jgi:hypothetical protein
VSTQFPEEKVAPEGSTGEAFGFDEPLGPTQTTSDGQPDPLFEDLEQQPAPQPAPGPRPEQPQVPQPQGPAAPQRSPLEELLEVPQPQQDPAQGPDPAQPAEPQGDSPYLGKYRTREEFEAAHNHLRRLQTETAEQRNAALHRAQQLEARLTEVVRALQTGEMPPELLAQLQQQAESGQPQDVQSAVRQMLQEEMATARQQELEVQRTEEIAAFRAAHPDVTPRSELDQAMGRILAELQRDDDLVAQYPNDPRRWLNDELFPVTRENLDLAYVLARRPDLHQMVDELDMIPTVENLQIANAAITNPRLRRIFVAEPHLLDTEEGVQEAFERAQLAPAVQNAYAQARMPQGNQVPLAAHVEAGGTGAPVNGAPGSTAQQGDEFDEAIASYNGDKARESVFFQ